MSDKTTSIARLFDKSYHVENAVLTMRGVGLMLEQYLDGTSFPMITSDNPQTINRLEDILRFACMALLDGADDLWAGTTELESEIMEELRAE